mgnify:CR=1 FL=1
MGVYKVENGGIKITVREKIEKNKRIRNNKEIAEERDKKIKRRGVERE